MWRYGFESQSLLNQRLPSNHNPTACTQRRPQSLNRFLISAYLPTEAITVTARTGGSVSIAS